eukprot:m.1384242 g.1384242  ORF g.1384242 m.1384242 type:complete len:279 (-) comp24973_c0_seq146:3803-4639(-)
MQKNATFAAPHARDGRPLPSFQVRGVTVAVSDSDDGHKYKASSYELDSKTHRMLSDRKRADSLKRGDVLVTDGCDLAPLWYNKLPFSSYALAPFLTLSHTAEEILSLKTWALVLLPHWLVSYLAIAAQVGMIYFIRDIGDEAFSDCGQSPYLLQLIAMLMYTTRVYTDFYESFKLAAYLWHIPTVPSWTDANVFVLDSIKLEPIDFATGHGITWWFRWIVVILIVVPKFIVRTHIYPPDTKVSRFSSAILLQIAWILFCPCSSAQSTAVYLVPELPAI